ncbi:hypothetical protein C1645_821959 [Glomus cerebriforme]|uniref:BTB/POZ domain-containing protein n=1 Tax=Glomus cerebriforme TaxID=658196 RepID=A0A397T3U0_9GLOM|nr:hypothetical protein C1645_821959 [Glomus cerebriforme]
MSDKFLPKLSENLLESLNDDQYNDIIIEVGNDPFVKIFRAHMVILSSRSPYLRRILSTINNDGALVNIKLPNILPEIFEIILRFIYGGRISLENYDTSDIIKILVAADELCLKELITYIQSFLIKKKSSWMEDNFNKIYRTSFKNESSFLELQKFCIDLIYKDPIKIFNSQSFPEIPEKLLLTLIQNDDDLQMSVSQIWEHVLNWGLSRNPELPSDPESFSKEDFKILKSTLQKCIPHIKFYNLNSKEFLEKVLPYKKVLPKELYNDLIKYFLDSQNNQSDKSKSYITKNISSKYIDSKIITTKHAELILSWINKSKSTPSSYRFKLLIRGSRDGFSPKKFHDICGRLSDTVSIIKVKYHNEILGGYNQISWESKSIVEVAKDNFIFSFKDNINNHILSRVKNEKHAISNWFLNGPSFGDGDLTLSGYHNYSDNSCKQSSYEKPIRETKEKFFVEEYEFPFNPGKTFLLNLLMSEIQGWEHGDFVQNPELPSNPTTFSKDDFKILKNLTTMYSFY